MHEYAVPRDYNNGVPAVSGDGNRRAIVFGNSGWDAIFKIPCSQSKACNGSLYGPLMDSKILFVMPSHGENRGSSPLGSATPDKFLNAFRAVSHCFRKRQSPACARFDPAARLAIAASASRSCSTSLRYTCTSDSVT